MLANGVRETTGTTGTGTVTLASVTGFTRFANGFANGELASYAIRDGNNWEWGVGTVGAGNTLARTTITATLVAGTYTTTGATAITLVAGASDVLGVNHTGTGLLPRIITGASGAVDAGNPSQTLHVITADNADVTTTAAVTQLTATGLGLGWWQVQYNLHWGSSAVGTGINFVVSHSGAAAPFMAERIDAIGSTTALATVGISHQTADEGVVGNLPSVWAANANTGSLGPNAGVTTINSIQFSTIKALFLVTTAGNLLLQVGSEVAASGVRLKAGSNARYTRLS